MSSSPTLARALTPRSTSFRSFGSSAATNAPRWRTPRLRCPMPIRPRWFACSPDARSIRVYRHCGSDWSTHEVDLVALCHQVGDDLVAVLGVARFQRHQDLHFVDAEPHAGAVVLDV